MLVRKPRLQQKAEEYGELIEKSPVILRILPFKIWADESGPLAVISKCVPGVCHSFSFRLVTIETHSPNDQIATPRSREVCGKMVSKRAKLSAAAEAPPFRFKPVSSFVEYKQVLEAVLAKESSILALTGPVGCGKSYAVRSIIEDLRARQSWKNETRLVSGKLPQPLLRLTEFEPSGTNLRANLHLATRKVVGEKRVVLIDNLDGFLPHLQQDIVHFLVHEWKASSFSPVVVTLASWKSRELCPLRELLPPSKCIFVKTPTSNELLVFDFGLALPDAADAADTAEYEARRVASAERCGGDIRLFLRMLEMETATTDRTFTNFELASACLSAAPSEVDFDSEFSRNDGGSFVHNLVFHNAARNAPSIHSLERVLNRLVDVDVPYQHLDDPVLCGVRDATLEKTNVVVRNAKVEPFKVGVLGKRAMLSLADVDSLKLDLRGPRPPPISWDGAESPYFVSPFAP